MKFAYMLSALAVATALTACANNHSDSAKNNAAAADPYGIASLTSSQQQPNVSGTISIRQRVALPPDAVLTVTLSDASLADAPSRVLAQKAVRTEGQQPPYNFVLPYNQADIKPNARILLSSAITVNGQLMFITDTVQAVVNGGGSRADLLLVPVQQTAVPVAGDGAAANTPAVAQ
ncbi:YbaY family lipoprotein [Raoultella sp. Ech2A]|jgi:putative lipoprotein|uniref:YbaY family lipoprotein n=1 Tax=Raoultella TaxID=160674 RepID=UPI0005F7A5DF|nr:MULTISPECIES: YbaY family lipoprotein [Raoultella]MDJ1652304.1 YbaY family lipoprotein [Raoultella sp. Ech2A]